MNIKSKIKTFYYFSLFFLVSTFSYAQFSPHFQNYTLSEYNAGNHNWDISKSDNGKLYVANDNGLLEFDGLFWKLWQLPNRTTIRSVLAHNDKIYTGSYEEFGYWQKDNTGSLEYYSLTDLLEKKEFSNEEFWQIIPHGESLIFRSFLNIYIYENGKIEVVKPPSTVMSCDVINDEIYVSTLKDGVYVLKNKKLSSLISNKILENTKIISISNNRNNDFLILTALKGCFIYRDGKLIPWETEINQLMKDYQLNNFLELERGNMVFGTLKNGVYVTDSKGKILFHISKENGLINNTVLGSYLDSNEQLWLGLDNGIASIDLNSNYSFYNDVSGKLGAVYDVIEYNDIIYIGSNTGLYFLDKENKLQFIEGSQGQVWYLEEIKGDLFCGHNNGTYLVDKNKLKLISEFTGGWMIKKAPEETNIFVQGTYTGLVCFKKEQGKWNVNRFDQGTDPIKYVAFEDEQIVWAANAYKGLYRIKFDETYDSIVEFKSYSSLNGLSSDYNVRVYNLNNTVSFKTNKGWQKYEPLLDSIVDNELLNESFGKNAYLISEDDVNKFTLKNDNFINFKDINHSNEDLYIANRYFESRLIAGNENVSKIKDSVYALNLMDGFMFINEKDFSKKSILEKPSIEHLVINDKLIDLTLNEAIKIPFNKNNSLRVSIASPNSEDHYFEYSVSNNVNIWNKIEGEKLELNNLLDGEYVILFRTANHFEDTSSTEPLKIKVLPPWYKAKEGYLLYFLLLLLTSTLIYILHNRKVNKEQKLLQLKFEHEQEELLREKALENEKEIVELKNASLRSEVKLKSKQLANTAMALVKKNEALLALKNELLLNESNFDNYFSFKKILKKVDSSIGHEDEWEIFEYNFNQVHEEFFKQLKDKFPHLTHKDLKICAYLKMNLSTKEIAPLMNISMRGVETHRYRLKKKLNLEGDTSVTSYLINLS